MQGWGGLSKPATVKLLVGDGDAIEEWTNKNFRPDNTIPTILRDNAVRHDWHVVSRDQIRATYAYEHGMEVADTYADKPQAVITQRFMSQIYTALRHHYDVMVIDSELNEQAGRKPVIDAVRASGKDYEIEALLFNPKEKAHEHRVTMAEVPTVAEGIDTVHIAAAPRAAAPATGMRRA